MPRILRMLAMTVLTTLIFTICGTCDLIETGECKIVIDKSLKADVYIAPGELIACTYVAEKRQYEEIIVGIFKDGTVVPDDVIESLSLPTEGSVLSEKDIQLIALVTMAEAEGECEEGKRLVIDTILNRVDSEYFPDTVHDVIYQPSHFSSMWNGRVDTCEITEEICQLVREEMMSRTNYDVMFFNANHYSTYGTPMFQVENHYFSKYE